MIDTKIRLIIFFAAKDGEALESAKTRPGANCGSDHELLIAKFRLKLKKVEKTNRPFRYDLNQIPYDCTVESLLGKSLWSWGSFQTISRFLSSLSLLSFFHSCQHPVLPSWLISITLWLYPLKLLSFSLWYILLSMSEVMALKSFLFFFFKNFFNTSDVILSYSFFFFIHP